MGVNSCVLACEHVFVHVCYCMHVVMKCWRKHGYWWVSGLVLACTFLVCASLLVYACMLCVCVRALVWLHFHFSEGACVLVWDCW